MRNEIIKDIGKLQSISETNALALPTALLYRATLRHLTGARVVPTQRLFSQRYAVICVFLYPLCPLVLRS